MPQVFTAVATIASTVFGGAAAGGFMATIGGRLLASVAIGALQAVIGKALAKSSESSGGIALDQTAVGGTNPMSFQLGMYATAGSAICPELVHGDDDYLNYVIAVSDVPGVQLNRLLIDGANAVIATTTPHADYGQRIEGVFRRERENHLAIDEDGNPTITSGFDDHAWIKWYDGSQTVADPMLLDRYSGDADFPWSADMIGRNLCYAILTFKYNKDIFETGKPACRFEVTGIPLYDPRKDSTVGGSGAHRWGNRATWEPSNNPMVQAYNILRGIRITSEITWGGNRTAAQLPLGTWFAAMNACDVLVTNANSTTERKYRSGIEVFLSDEPAQVLTELGKACSAEFANVGGTWFVNVGSPPLPTFFFTDENILYNEDYTTELMNGDLSDVYNAAIVTFPSPTAGWEKKSTAPMLFPALQAEDQDQRLLANLELPAVPYPRQAQRVGREYVKDSRRRRRSGLALGPESVAIDLTGCVSWTSEENGYTAKVFQVESITEDILSMKRVINIREKNPADYDWSTTYELPDDPSVGKPLVRKQLSMQGFFAEPWIVRDTANSARRSTIRLRWDIDDIPDRVTGVEWRGRLAGATSFSIMGSTAAARVGMAIESNVVATVAYQFQARYLTANRPGVWTGWYNVTAPNVKFGEADMSDDFYDGVRDIADLAGVKIVSTLPAAGDKPNQIVCLVPPGRLYRWDATAGVWTQNLYAGIEAGSLDVAAFASGIRPVEIMSTLPGTGNFAGRTVFLTTDSKLYRHTGSPSDATGFTVATDGADITANSITGGKISAGAISTDQLAAGAVVASKIAVTDYQSLILDSEMESGAPGSANSVWAKVYGYDTYCTYGEQGVAFTALAGNENAKYCVRIAPTPASSSSAGVSVTGAQNHFTAEAGQEYYISMKAWLASTGTARLRTGVSWRRADGSEISYQYGSTKTLTTVGQWVEIGQTLVAPPGAVRGIPRFIRLADNTNAADVFIARPRVARRNAGELIVDGSITANHINAGAITTDKIAANAIVASKLAAGEVVTLSAQIKDAIINNAKIANLSVNTIKIADNSVSIILSNTGNPTTSTGGINITINPAYTAKLVVLVLASDLQMPTGISSVKIKWNGTTVEDATYGGFDGTEANSIAATYTRTVSGGSGPHTLRAEAGSGTRASGDTRLTMIAILTYK